MRGSCASTMAGVHAELGQLLDAQGGVVTSAQALTFLTRRGLEAQIKSGALKKLWHGIYGCGELMHRRCDYAALDLASGTTVAACMGTAAAAYGFGTERTSELHVLSPVGRRLRSAEGLIVHRREGAPLTSIAGRPATAPAWTAIEVARSLRRPRALATLDAALRSGTCSRGGLQQAARRQSGRRGIVDGPRVARPGKPAGGVADGERGAACHDRRRVAAAGPAIPGRGPDRPRPGGSISPGPTAASRPSTTASTGTAGPKHSSATADAPRRCWIWGGLSCPSSPRMSGTGPMNSSRGSNGACARQHERAQNARLRGVSLCRHARSRNQKELGAGSRADIAGRTSP